MKISITYNGIRKVADNDTQMIMKLLESFNLPDEDVKLSVSCKKNKLEHKEFTYFGSYQFARVYTAKNIISFLGEGIEEVVPESYMKLDYVEHDFTDVSDDEKDEIIKQLEQFFNSEEKVTKRTTI